MYIFGSLASDLLCYDQVIKVTKEQTTAVCVMVKETSRT
jgi:hypothetical protein